MTQGSFKLNSELKDLGFCFLVSVEDESTFPEALKRIDGLPDTCIPTLFYLVPGG